MKKYTFAAIAAGSAAMITAGFALAEPPHGDGGWLIEKLDTNGDGSITKAEVEAAKAAKFAAADANGDGGLTMAEMEAFREAERARMMEAMKTRMFNENDANGDGVISIDEFDSRGMPLFDHVDANDDGILTAEEMTAMREKGDWHHRRGGPGGSHGPDR